MTDEQPLEVFDQADDGLVTELAVRDFAEAGFAGLACHADQRRVHVLDDPAAVFVTNRRRKWVPKEQRFDVGDLVHAR